MVMFIIVASRRFSRHYPSNGVLMNFMSLRIFNILFFSVCIVLFAVLLKDPTTSTQNSTKTLTKVEDDGKHTVNII